MQELFKNVPHLFDFHSIGDQVSGYITVAEGNNIIPFQIKRVYWTYSTPQNVTRGYHAHKTLQQVIFAVNGIIKFTVEELNGNKSEFVLDQPHKGLYLPPFTWREIQFSHNAVLLCLASDSFMEMDYIRDYEDYKSYKLP